MIGFSMIGVLALALDPVVLTYELKKVDYLVLTCNSMGFLRPAELTSGL